MSKVWLVSTGDYSEYHVHGVYSTEEKALVAKEAYNADKIEERELDAMPDSPPGLYGWLVRMDQDGNTEHIYRVSNDVMKGEYGWHPARTMGGDAKIGFVNFCVWARDQEHAVKIANEKRAGLIASGEWTTDWRRWAAKQPQTGRSF
jgi:hypothetical protein